MGLKGRGATLAQARPGRLLALSVLVVALGLTCQVPSAAAQATVTCTPYATSQELVIAISGTTSSAEPFSLTVSGGNYVISLGGTQVCTDQSFSDTAFSYVKVSSPDAQYVVLDDSNGALASDGGCPVQLALALAGTASTVEVKTSTSGSTTGIGSNKVTLSEAGCALGPDLSTAGVGTLVVTGSPAIGNTLDLSGSSGSLTVNEADGPDTVSGFTDSSWTTLEFSNEHDVIGSDAGNTTVLAGPASLNFFGRGSNNVLDLSQVAGPTQANFSGVQVGGVPTNTVVAGSINDFAPGVTTVIGSRSGDTTFFAGQNGMTFAGQGPGNVLDLSDGSWPAPPSVDLSSSSVTWPGGPTQGGDSLVAGGVTEGVSGVATVIGALTGFTKVAPGSDPLTFSGNGSGNELDLSQLSTSPSAPVQVNLSGQTVSAPRGTTTYTGSGVSTVDGAPSGYTTLVAGTTNTSFLAQGPNNELDLSWVPSSPGSPITANFSTTSVNGVAGDTVSGGSVSDYVKGVNSVVGPRSGYATFFPGNNGMTFSGQGPGNTLDLSAVSASPVIVNLSGQALSAPTSVLTFSATDMSNVIGPPFGQTTFVAGAGNMTVTGQGAGNALDLSQVPSPIQANFSGSTTSGGQPTDTVAASGGTDHVNGITKVIGSLSGYTTFVAGESGVSFSGQGPNNTLDLSHLSSSSPVTADYSGDANTNTVTTGTITYTATGIATVLGPLGGNTTFLAGTTPMTFTGQGPNNTLDVSGAPPHAIVNLAGQSLSPGDSALTFAATGMSNVIGPTSGYATFVAGPGNTTLTSQGTGNELDLSQLPSSASHSLVVNLTGEFLGSTFPYTVASSSSSDTIRGEITRVVGPQAGNARFVGGPDGISFSGQGSGNVLDLSELLSSATSPVHANLGSSSVTWSDGTVQSAGTIAGSGMTETVSGMSTVIGSAAGYTSVAPGASDLTFIGYGIGNEFDLARLTGFSSLVAATAAPSCGAGFGQVTSTGGSPNLTDCFDHVGTIDGAAQVPTTFVPDPNAVATPSPEPIFVGEDAGNGGSVLDLASFTSPDSSGYAVTGLKVALNGNASGDPGLLTAQVNGTPVTFGSFANINKIIGPTTVSAALDPGTARGVALAGIAPLAQKITFTSTPPAPATVGGTYRPTAVGGASGDPVVFSIDSASSPGACALGGGVVSFIGPGTCLLDANQAGGDEYQAAPQAQQTIHVSGGANGGSGSNRPAPGAHASILHRSTKTTTAVVSVSCTAAPGGICTVTLTITVVEKMNSGKRTARRAKHPKVKTVVVASKTITLGAGHTELVRIALNRAGRRLLAASRVLKATLVVAQPGQTISSYSLTFHTRAPHRRKR